MFVRKLRTGDKVLLRENTEVEVRSMILGELPMEGDRPVAYLHDTIGRQWRLHPGDIVELIHRPWPEGVGAGSYLRTAHDLMDRFRKLGPGPERDKVLADLRQEIEAYELGKPTDEEVKRARQFVDKHMTP